MSVETHDSPQTIKWSPRPTLGIEQELHVVRLHDGQLGNYAPPLLWWLKRMPGVAPYVDSEYMANTIELTTPISVTVAEAVNSLRRVGLAAQIVAAKPLKFALSPIGIHPFANPDEQAVTDTPRYHRSAEREQTLAREQQIIGVHFHVGVHSREMLLAAMDELSIYTPLFVALSASSPFLEGRDTGFEAFQLMLNDRLPPSGVPPHFETWDDYTSWFDSMKATGYVHNLTDVWWDIRPSRYGTVEMRVADGIATHKEIGALAALAQCLVVSVAQPGFVRRHLPFDQLRLNRFEAQRYGVDAAISLHAGEARRPLREHLSETVARLLPIARELHCEAELLSLLALPDIGSSARRQRAVSARTGSLHEVVRSAVKELRQGLDDRSQSTAAPLEVAS